MRIFYHIMRTIERHICLIIVIGVAVTMLLPFLGLTEFTTKGEPREAVVALSMIDGGDWILPVNNGCDIPYKPPFMHWIIALFALADGQVSEYVSRLPSALSLIALTIGCYCFFARRKGQGVSTLAALLMLTSFEVHRAGVNCRVDMVLTACTVGAILLLYRWRETRKVWIAALAVLCMSGAVMTKGPVGMVLPCLAIGIYSLLRGDRLWPLVGRMTVVGLLACVLPALWYIAAYREGGQHFLDLVLEENVGRMTGTMSYGSHEHSWPYNFFTLFTGWAPWTLLAVFSLFALPWRKMCLWMSAKARKPEWRTWPARLREADPVQLFIWVAFWTVFVFYCLPSSKRSVYLLPCYPFMAMLLAQYIVWLVDSGRRAPVRAFAVVLSVLAIGVTAAFAAIRMGWIPEAMTHGRHAADNIAMVEALAQMPLNRWLFVLVAVPAIAGADLLIMMVRRRSRNDRNTLTAMPTMLLITIFLALDGVYQPTVMNTKTLRPMAELIDRQYPNDRLYSYIADDMMHFFGANFYCGDRIGEFESARPDKGVLLIVDNDRAAFFARHTDYTFTLDGDAGDTKNEMKQKVYFYRFERK